jgi:small-conductance mechanosensitive channel
MSNLIYTIKIFPVYWKVVFTASLALLLLTVPLFRGSPVAAQTTNLLSVSRADAQKNEAELKAATPAQQRIIITRALTEATTERDRSLSGSAGFTPQEAQEKFRLLDGQVTRLNSQLNLIDEREELRRTRVAADQKAKSWTGFPEPPPYSILMVDEIMGSLQTARAKSQGLETNRKLLNRQVSQYREAAQQARETERQKADELERAQTSDARLTATRHKELAGIRAENADIMAVLLALRSELLGERLGLAAVELDLLVRQLAEARKRMVFTQADLDKALARLKARRTDLEQELEAALYRDARSRSRLIQSRKDLDSFTLRHDKADTAAATLAGRAEREAEQRAALAWVESSRFEIEVVTALITINKIAATSWEQRYIAVTGTDAEKRHAILAEFRKSRELLKPWLEFAKHQLEMYQAAEHEQELRLTKIVEQSPLRAAESDLQAARLLQREMAERQKTAVQQADVERQSWLEDIERIQQSRNFAVKTRDWLKTVPNILRSVWRFELFAIEDSMEVAGQKVVTSRGVTVGKSAGAILLFLFGYSITAFLGRRVQQIMILRFGVSAHQANVIRRWLMALTIFTLLVITLNLARIPLTVFAFLGGALAIGIGFGTQTIIKNFISGILILMERNMKVGDTVEVDGVVGRVVTVDMRASTILGFDGVETVIPNSTFLENKVTNWTHTNARLRRFVRVGVACGSPTTRVRDILTECGAAHDLILKNPPPEVFFEDFGDSSLIFTLYFWIDYGPAVNPLQVASDLRFMIDQRFTEEKIVLAFPQRDVHLDSSLPIRIEMIPAPA